MVARVLPGAVGLAAAGPAPASPLEYRDRSVLLYNMFGDRLQPRLDPPVPPYAELFPKGGYGNRRFWRLIGASMRYQEIVATRIEIAL